MELEGSVSDGAKRCVRVHVDRVDGDLTQKQFGTLFKSLLPAIDLNYKRLTETMETGTDPGEVTPASVSGDALPSKLRGLLDKIKGDEDDDDGGFGKV